MLATWVTALNPHGSHRDTHFAHKDGEPVEEIVRSCFLLPLLFTCSGDLGVGFPPCTNMSSSVGWLDEATLSEEEGSI
jgi:hypothetical protein